MWSTVSRYLRDTGSPLGTSDTSNLFRRGSFLLNSSQNFSLSYSSLSPTPSNLTQVFCDPVVAPDPSQTLPVVVLYFGLRTRPCLWPPGVRGSVQVQIDQWKIPTLDWSAHGDMCVSWNPFTGKVDIMGTVVSLPLVPSYRMVPTVIGYPRSVDTYVLDRPSPVGTTYTTRTTVSVTIE